MTVHNILKTGYDALPRPVRAALTPVKTAYQRAIYERQCQKLMDPIIRDVGRAAAGYAGEKIVIDCGFNSGRVLERFIRILPDFKFYGFEVNEGHFGARAREMQKRYPNIQAMNFAAVATHEGTIKFEIAGGVSGALTAECTSIMPGFMEGHESAPELGEDRTREIACVDFPKWLKETAARHTVGGAAPYIALKVDIEGAEYDVLEAMLRDGSAACVDDLLIEFHSGCFGESLRPDYERREREIRDGFQAVGARVFDWPL